MESVQLQQLLFYIGVALIVIGVLLAAGAFYMFRKFDILDIRDDLSGKKRAEGVAKMLAEQASGKSAGKNAKARRSQKTLAAGQTTGHLGTGGTGAVDGPATGDASAQLAADAAQPAPQAQQSAAPRREVAAPVPQFDEADENTTIMAGENEATTILGDADATTQYKPIQVEEPQAEVTPAEEPVVEDLPAVEPVASDAEPEVAPIEMQDEAIVDVAPAIVAPEVDMTSAEMPAAKPAALEHFHIVRKIVLTESAEYVRVERGDSNE